MPKKYRNKPVVIEAMQLRNNNVYQCMKFMENEPNFKCEMDKRKFDEYEEIVRDYGLPIRTLEGDIVAKTGDYIIKGVEGEFYSCKPGIFKKIYEEVE